MFDDYNADGLDDEPFDEEIIIQNDEEFQQYLTAKIVETLNIKDAPAIFQSPDRHFLKTFNIFMK